jgi:hypothetical protein
VRSDAELRVVIDGSPPIVLEQKQAAAVVVAFLVLTPLGRLSLAAGLFALLLAGFVGHWVP